MAEENNIRSDLLCLRTPTGQYFTLLRRDQAAKEKEESYERKVKRELMQQRRPAMLALTAEIRKFSMNSLKRVCRTNVTE